MKLQFRSLKSSDTAEFVLKHRYLRSVRWSVA